ncbi:hypothetical protein E2562_000683 [Oryza meyeriana var. granulata]|uniref:Uncharacterized protein n=1 Tax=Oryza meyeriana var. granulata TaxID=110450 RepID=A0A6G1DT93_9ORYZ|nr:hypothetical protein E2562_000683 [Oryza meyeriana var. granulata]
MDCVYYKGIDDDDSKKQQQEQAQDGGDALRRAARRLLPCMACLIVAGHVAACTYRAAGDPRDLAFVAGAYAMLAMLLCCVARFEALADDGSPAAAVARERLKLPVWALSTALTALFSTRVAPMMPPPLNALVVAMALLVTVGGFCLLFLCDAGNAGDDDDEAASDQDEKV